MKLSINANYVLPTRDPNRRRTIEEAFRLCREAGFEVLDYSPRPLDGEWGARVDEAIRAAEKFGIELEQSHAPFNFYTKIPSESFSVLLDRSVEAAIRMKNRQLVFHMDEYHAPSVEEYDPQAALESAYETLAPHIEKALAGGVSIALETIFEDRFVLGKQGRAHFCGVFEELVAALEKFDHPNVGCCWDFGHAHLSYGKEELDKMRALGKKIICTHTHDCYYKRDLHVMPFTGELSWETLMPTLKEIGYSGNLTFEFVYGRIPDRLVELFLKQAWETGGCLIDMFEGKEVL